MASIAARFSHWLGLASSPQAAVVIENDDRPEPTLDELVAKVNDEIAKATAEGVVFEKASATKRTGAPGYAAYGGHLATDERNPDMVGDAKWKNFGEFKRNIAPVAAGLRSYLVLLGAPDWEVEPYKADDAEDATPEDVARAQFAWRALHNMETPWKTCVQVAGMKMFDGAAWQEWTLKRVLEGKFAGKYGLLDLEARPMSTIVRYQGIEEEGRVTGIIQRSPQTSAEIPIERGRLAWHRDLPITDSPEGCGVLRQLANSIREMLELRRMRNTGYEKDLNGVPICYAPIEESRARIGQPDENGKVYTEADFRQQSQALLDLIAAKKRKDAGVLLDSGMQKDQDGKLTSNPLYKVELLSAQATSHAELNKTIREYAYEILMVIGFEHLLIGGDGVGSLALHASKIAGTLRIVTSVLNEIALTMQRDVLRPLWIYNGWDPETVPKLTWDVLEFSDLDKVVQSLASILMAGAVEPGRADKILERILAHLGLPPLLERDDEDVLLRREEAADKAGLKPRNGATRDENNDDELDLGEED